MGSSFWESSTNVHYDPIVLSLLGGVGRNYAAVNPDEEEGWWLWEHVPDNSYVYQLRNTGLLEVNSDAKNFGLLRAAALAYSQTDTGDRTAGKGARVPGPFLDAYTQINTNWNSVTYRDPTVGRADKPIELTAGDITLANLMAMLTEGKAAYGTDDVTWTGMFGSDGIVKFRALMTEISNALATIPMAPLTTVSRPVAPSAPSSPNVPSIEDAAQSTATDATASTWDAPTVPEMYEPSAPEAIDFGLPTESTEAVGAVVEEVPVLGTGEGDFTEDDISPDDTNIGVTAPELLNEGEEETIFNVAEPTLDPTYIASIEGIFADIAALLGAFPEQQIDTEDISGLTVAPETPAYDPDNYDVYTYSETDITNQFLLNNVPIAPTPVVVTTPSVAVEVEDHIDDAVNAYSSLEDIKNVEALSALQANLAATRQVLTSHFDMANTLFTAAMLARRAEYDQSLRIEQARLKVQAGLALEESKLQYKRLDVENARSYFAQLMEIRKVISEFIIRYKEYEQRDAQYKTSLSAQFQTTIADNTMKANMANSGYKLDAHKTNAELKLRALTTNAELTQQAGVAQTEQMARMLMANAETTLRAALATAENILRARTTTSETVLRARVAQAENYTRAALATSENMLRASIATAENMLRAAISTAENTVRASSTNAEISARFAIAGAENLTRANVTGAELTLRADVAGTDNKTRTALSHAENLLRSTMAIAENATRVSQANAEGKTRVSITNAENTLRTTLARADAHMRILEIGSRYNLADLENKMRIALSNSDIDFKVQDNSFRREVAENERILGVMRLRNDIAKVFYDITLGWMSARTNAAGLAGQIITAGMQAHTVQTEGQRTFDLNAERQRWDMLTRQNDQIASLAELEWKSIIQNIMLIKEACSAIGLVPTGTEHHPSGFEKVGQVVSGIGATVSTGLNIYNLFK